MARPMAAAARGYRVTLARMALADALRRPARLALLAAGIAVAGAATFVAIVFQASIASSLDRSLARLGADALVLPASVTPNLTPTLLTVEPTTAHMVGLPGLKAIRPNCTWPSSAKSGLMKSRVPIDTPPLVISTSARANPSRTRARWSSG